MGALHPSKPKNTAQVRRSALARDARTRVEMDSILRPRLYPNGRRFTRVMREITPTAACVARLRYLQARRLSLGALSVHEPAVSVHCW